MVRVSGPSDREREPEIVAAVGEGQIWLQESARPATCWISSDSAVNREDCR